ncbi:MAG: hypothetical protein ACI8UO_001107 [Verrucomicrobiales bacterium]|jgi:hypothetical protein
MQTRYEITGKFEQAADCNSLLYAPLKKPLSFRRARSYEFDFAGPVDAVTNFVGRCLFDKISQNLHTGEEAWSGEAFILEFGMRPGALDLEKEAILNYYKSLSSPGFEIEKLAIRDRIYVFGDVEDGVSDQFVRDIVNTAVHTFEILRPACV